MNFINKLKQELITSLDGEKEYSFYRGFHNEENATKIVDLLKANNITYLISKTQQLLDQNIMGSTFQPPIMLKIKTTDFDQVNQLLKAYSINLLEGDIESHYLNQLNDDELQEIFRLQDKWTPEDVQIAQLVLHSRKIEIKDEDIELLKKERNEELRLGKEASNLNLVLTLLTIVIGVFVQLIFILGGLSMSLYYFRSKSVDLYGKKYYNYNKKSRDKGIKIFVLGVIFLIVGTLYLFLKN